MSKIHISSHGKIYRLYVPVAQRIECRPPKPKAGVRVSPGTPSKTKIERVQMDVGNYYHADFFQA